MDSNQDSNNIYAGLVDRVKASVIDGLMLLVFMISFSYVFSLFEDVPNALRLIALVFVFVLYEPIFTSVFGGTLGHLAHGLNVRKEGDETRNINVFAAIFRFVFKVLLGWISLLTVSSNAKQRAIHDLVGGSVIIYKKKSK